MDAILVPVSQYIKYNNLPGVMQDQQKMDKMLKDLFGVTPTILPNDGYLTKDDFDSKFIKIYSDLVRDKANTSPILFYFAGHGSKADDRKYSKHEIHLTDGSVGTWRVIDKLSRLNRELIIILDCCYAGSVDLNRIKEDISGKVNEILDKGVSIYCAAKSDQLAQEDDRGGGYFTNKLIELLYDTSNSTIEYTRTDLVNFLRKRWDPEAYQAFVFKSNNLGNPIIFSKAKKEYVVKKVDYETDCIKILRVDPAHNIRKRYILHILLKKELSDIEWSNELQNLHMHADKFEIYSTSKQEVTLKSNRITHLFVFFYMDQEDFAHSLYKWKATWVDPQSNRDSFYQNNGQMISDFYVEKNSIYEPLKKFHVEHTSIDDNELLNTVDELVKNILIRFGNFDMKFQESESNHDEGELLHCAKDFETELKNVDVLLGNLEFASSEKVQNISNIAQGISSHALSCLFFFTSDKHLNSSLDDRRTGYRNWKKYFYEDVDKYKQAIEELRKMKE